MTAIAIYIRREDGDFNFVAAFSEDYLPSAPSDWPNEIADWFKSQMEEVMLINGDFQKFPDVWDGTARNLRQFRVLKHDKNQTRLVSS